MVVGRQCLEVKKVLRRLLQLSRQEVTGMWVVAREWKNITT